MLLDQRIESMCGDLEHYINAVFYNKTQNLIKVTQIITISNKTLLIWIKLSSEFIAAGPYSMDRQASSKVKPKSKILNQMEPKSSLKARKEQDYSSG